MRRLFECEAASSLRLPAHIGDTHAASWINGLLTVDMRQSLIASMQARARLGPLAFRAIRARSASVHSRFGAAIKPVGKQGSDVFYLQVVASPTPDGSAGRLYECNDRMQIEYMWLYAFTLLYEMAQLPAVRG